MKRIFKNIALMACAGLMLNACDLDEFNPSAGDASLTSFDAWSGLHSYSYSCLNDELYYCHGLAIPSRRWYRLVGC